MLPIMLDLARLRALYGEKAYSPIEVASTVAARMAASKDPAIFIHAVDRDGLVGQAEDLLARAPDPNSLPLWGIPFAVKDNIDVAGMPTTAACPDFAYTPQQDAFVVARLKAAGALVTGKTNLDQFATGLNGTRSPYGAPRCVFDPRYISGGSSSGSAVAVAAGLASFTLGTDTAGSGRVPAAFNNIVGIKPTPGRLSTSGLVPACQTLDCITIFAATVADGVEVRRLVEGFDVADCLSRFEPPVSFGAMPLRVGILRPEDRVFFGDAANAALYDSAIERLDAMGARAVGIDYAPFIEAAKLLYDGPWVAERLAAVGVFFETHPGSIDPAVFGILESAKAYTAVDAFEGLYELETLTQRTAKTWADVDMLMLPTVPTTYTVDAMRADPIRLNSTLGQYTNFGNLMRLAAIAVPAGFRPDGLPFGVTLIGPGGSDDALAPLADAIHRTLGEGMGCERGAPLPEAPIAANDTQDTRLKLAVVGAHLSGMPLNHQLTDLGGVMVGAATTAADYRLFALPGTVPAKPGLVRDPGFSGPGIEVEIWALPPNGFARFVSAIPAPLGVGSIMLGDGTWAQGFLCERHAVEGAEDVTAFRGWRGYTQSKN